MQFNRKLLIGAAILAICALSVPAAFAAPLPGGTLDPLTIPKYVTPLVIPPVMKDAAGNNTTNDYDIAVRQFQQQILPGGIWTGGGGLPATTVWSYGPASDAAPDSSLVPGGAAGVAPAPLNPGALFTNGSQFNYPAFTVENTVDVTTTVDWINDLKDGAGNFLPYLIPGVVDQTLHWANPVADCIMGDPRTDCSGTNPAPYEGPNPIITHVHGAHVGPESDGYPEAWYLPNPAGSNFTCVTDPSSADPANGVYVCEGTLVNQYGTTTNTPGVGSFTYPNDQPSTTLWYHDHTLGMTRLNVYAGPAGFWLIRQNDGGEDGLGATSILPGPAPGAGEDPNFEALERLKVREIPIAIQDRSFNGDGSLFYPKNRAFFEGLGDGSVSGGNFAAGLNIDFDPATSDIAPIWNPEAFFNTMVVNGTTWPVLEVAPALYRFRLLNGCNSRFLNLSLKPVDPVTGQPITLRVTETTLLKNGKTKINTNAKLTELPFYQIGAEQSLLPQVVMIKTGSATPLPGDGTVPTRLTAAASKDQALLMGLAERADVIVDFSSLPNGTVVQMFNTAPDAPFGGFPDIPADPTTTGQVMRFVVNSTLANSGGPLGASPTDPVLANGLTNASAATAPNMLGLSLPDAGDLANGPVFPGARDLALIEEESALVCVNINAITGFITQDTAATPDLANPGTCTVGGVGGPLAASVPFAPKAAVLGTSGATATPAVTLWSDPIVTNPVVGATETWELWNHTVDGHPIHLHLVKFKVVDRQAFDPLTGALVGPPIAPAATEAGWKDTVIAYPGEVTRVNATFDTGGLYVWHCHIVEHEDNEMMVPFMVGTPDATGAPGSGDFPDPFDTIKGLL